MICVTIVIMVKIHVGRLIRGYRWQALQIYAGKLWKCNKIQTIVYEIQTSVSKMQKILSKL